MAAISSRRFFTLKRAVPHAGTVYHLSSGLCLDSLINTLREQGLKENTLILFADDTGAQQMSPDRKALKPW